MPATALVLGHSGLLAAEDLIVKYDQSQLLGLPGPAAEIIIGNPAITDIAIQSANLLVVTGKSFSITNINALDAERTVIQDQHVLVRWRRCQGRQPAARNGAADLQLHAPVQSLNCHRR